MGHRVPGVVICPPWFTMAGRANHNVDINDLHSALHVQSIHNVSGAADILFLSNNVCHIAPLNAKVFGRRTLVGAILPGCLEC